MLRNLSLQQNYILQLFITTLLYGTYLTIFATALRILTGPSPSRSKPNRRLLLFTSLLFLFTTLQCICQLLLPLLTTEVLAAVPYDGITEEADRQKDIDNLLGIISDALAVTNNSLADGLLIWRCYNVWNRRRRVVLVPFLMLVTETLCGYSVVGIVTYLYRLRLSIPRPITLQSVPEQWWHMAGVESWVTVAFYALSLVTNVTVTVLIAWKIWKTTKESREFFGPTHGRRLTRVLLLMVESGAFYSLCLLLSCIFSLIEDRSTAWFVTTAVTNQVVGIAPTLIVILVSPHSMRQPTTWISVVSGLTSPAEDNHERKKAQRLAVEIPAENVRRLTVELTPRFDLDVELGVGRKEEGSMESHEGGR